MVNYKIHDITVWLANNHNAYIAQYNSRIKGNQTIKFGQSVEYNKRTFSFNNHAKSEAEILLKHLDNSKSFYVETKSISHYF